MFLKALDVFPYLQPKLLLVCEQLATHVWNQKEEVQGTGLCHGLAGHGYTFHSLYRKYEELAPKAWSDCLEEEYKERAAKWRSRAFEYAKRLCK